MEPVAGEQADQVVEAVAARGTVVEQAEVDELVECLPGVLDRHPGGGCGQGGVEALSRYCGQPPEHPPGRIGELLVRHPERLGDLEVPRLELMQPALLVHQPFGKLGGVPSGPADQPVSDDPQGKRQTAAQLGQPREGRFPVGCGTSAQDPGQQCGGLRHRQGSEGKPAYAFQTGEQPSGGDQGPARAPSRQQRTHLLLRRGIVEDDQHPFVAQQRPVQGGAPRHVVRDLPLRGTQGTKERPQRVAGGQRLPGHAAQIEEEHSVRKARPDGMGSTDRKGGLAQPR
ncbi:hypothetical protein V4Y03_31705 [Streptomyces sp. P9-A4]